MKVKKSRVIIENQENCAIQLSYDELRKALRKKKTKCEVDNCDNIATDIHHKDGDHSNNEPSNICPSCKKHHDEIHGITPQMSEMGALVRTYWDIQEFRKAIDNRIRAYTTIGYPTDNFTEVAKDIKKLEKDIEKQVKKTVKTHIMYEEAMKVKGLGTILTAGLISIIGDPRRFSNPSKIWKFFGLHTNDGSAVKRKRGEKLGFSIWRRSFAWKIGDQFNRQRKGDKPKNNIGKLMVQYHDFYKQQEFPENELVKKYKGKSYKKSSTQLTKGHALNRARRKVVKVFLACFWSKWMELIGEEAVSPYAHKLKKHKKLIKWEDIIN